MIHFRISFAVCRSLSLSLKVQYTKTARIRRSEPVCANLLSLFVGWRGIGKILEYFYNYFLIFSSKWRPGIREYSGFVLTFYFKNIWIYVNIYIFYWICKYFVQFWYWICFYFFTQCPSVSSNWGKCKFSVQIISNVLKRLFLDSSQISSGL